MSILKDLVALMLVAVALPVAKAEPHCPGSVTSLPLRLVERSQIVVPVTINHTGPYDFLVDTGAQVTTVDPALAAALQLMTRGTAGVVGVGVYARAPGGAELLEEEAREFGAFKRARKVESAVDQLRLVLAYCWGRAGCD